MSDNESRYSQRFPRDRQLRVGDQDREAVAAILRREHVAGRLDNSEFDERLSRCLSAKNYADLDLLIRDFPADARAAEARQWGARRFGVVPFLSVVPIVVGLIVFSHGRLFWLAFPLVFFLVVRPLLRGRSGRLGTRRTAFANARYSSRYMGGCAPGIRR
jgi:hypothetical protein